MNLDIRKRILLIAGVVLLILIVLVLFLLRRAPKASPAVTPTPTETTQPAEVTPQPTTLELPPPPPPANAEEREKLYAVQLSKIFMERYGSYSNQSQGGNVDDVKDLVSERFFTYIQSQKEQYNAEYKGVSTKVISSSLETFDKDKATVVIGVQQLLEEQGKNPVTSYKNGKISLVKSDGSWKVDGLFWNAE